MKQCPKCRTKASKYWKVMVDKAKCYKCGYEWRKNYKQETLQKVTESY